MLRADSFVPILAVVSVRRVVDRDPDGHWFVWYPSEEEYQRWLWSGLE